jgi:hypothetical protein
MKKIFLIGDSIRYGIDETDGYRCGYGYYTARKLLGEMEVFAPKENCRFLQYTLRYLHEWAKKEGVGADIDVVHWNNGLWDMLRLLGDEPFTPLEAFGPLLIRVHSRIRQIFPNAKIIYALTTPVIESLSSPDFTRRNEEIEAYNREAVRVLSPLGVTINDLYTPAKKLQDTYHYDWVHFNEKGSDLLADHVIAAIRKVL